MCGWSYKALTHIAFYNKILNSFLSIWQNVSAILIKLTLYLMDLCCVEAFN